MRTCTVWSRERSTSCYIPPVTGPSSPMVRGSACGALGSKQPKVDGGQPGPWAGWCPRPEVWTMSPLHWAPDLALYPGNK